MGQFNTRCDGEEVLFWSKEEGSLKWASSLFNELGSWHDKSQIEFSNILNSHNTNIIEGINSLISEVHDLHEQLRITTKEKNTFIKTVENLNGEIRNLKSEVITLRSLHQAQQNYAQDKEEGYHKDRVVQEHDDNTEAHREDSVTEF